MLGIINSCEKGAVLCSAGMGRGRGVPTRKEATHENVMVGRRFFMDCIQPFPVFPSKRSYAEFSYEQNFPPIPVSKFATTQQSVGRVHVDKRPRTNAPLSSSSAKPVSRAAAGDGPQIHVPKPYPHPSKYPILNFLYAPFRMLDTEKILASARNQDRIYARVHVPTEHLTASNPAVEARHLWGHQWYTEDSDIVAVVLHSGHFRPTVKPPDTYQYLSVLIELERHRRGKHREFPAHAMNGLVSREWGSSFEGAALRVDAVAMVGVDVAEIPSRRYQRESCRHVPRLIPWDAPKNSSLATSVREGKGTPKRSNSLNGLIAFDMLNEPCLVFDLKEVVSLQHPDAILQRLRYETLYVESATDRWEISLVDADPPDTHIRVGRVTQRTLRDLRLTNAGISLCKDEEHVKLTVPLSVKCLDIIAKCVPWSDLVWDCDGVTVNGKHLNLSKMCFREHTC